jgi:hypothetical protein
MMPGINKNTHMNELTCNELSELHAGGSMAQTSASEVAAGAAGLALAANFAGKPIPGSAFGASLLAAFSLGVMAGGAIDWSIATIFDL